MSNRPLRRPWLGLALALALAGLAACAAPPAAPPTPTPELSTDQDLTPPPGSTKQAGPCPRLDPKLLELSELADPTARAAELSVTLEGGRAFVALLLRDEAPADLAAYDAEITTQIGGRAQGFVPLDQLCALANDPAVLAVQPPVTLTP